jgi:hypothetical protein
MVTFRDAPTLTPQTLAAFDPVVLKQGPAWYKGDLHVHDTESGDAGGTFQQIIDLARMRGLDFVSLSDHNTVSQHGLQAVLQQGLTDLLLVRSCEVTTYSGHGGAMGSSSYIDHRVGYNGRTKRAIIEDAQAQGAIFVVNHPTLDLGNACIGCAWKDDDTPWDQVNGLEIQNGSWQVTNTLFTPKAIMLWDMQEDAGHHIAPVGGSDDHTAGMNEGPTGSPVGSPTTLVYAQSLSEPDLVQAIREGRTVVLMRGPDDPLVEITATSDVDGSSAMIGDTLTARTVTLQAHVTGGDGYGLNIFRNGAIDQGQVVAGDDWTGTFMLPVNAGGDRFRAQLNPAGINKPVVITGHIYALSAVGPADGGPGDGGTGGDVAVADGSTGDSGGGGNDAPTATDRGAADTTSGGDTSVAASGGCSVAVVPGPGGAAGPAGAAALLLLGAVIAASRRRRSRG